MHSLRSVQPLISQVGHPSGDGLEAVVRLQVSEHALDLRALVPIRPRLDWINELIDVSAHQGDT